MLWVSLRHQYIKPVKAGRFESVLGTGASLNMYVKTDSLESV